MNISCETPWFKEWTSNRLNSSQCSITACGWKKNEICMFTMGMYLGFDCFISCWHFCSKLSDWMQSLIYTIALNGLLFRLHHVRLVTWQKFYSVVYKIATLPVDQPTVIALKVKSIVTVHILTADNWNTPVVLNWVWNQTQCSMPRISYNKSSVLYNDSWKLLKYA